MEQIHVGGHLIAFDKRGDGPPLFLLHGYVGDRRTWRRQIDHLSDEFTVIAWDAPGFGGSSDPPATFTLSDYADVLAAFIEALGARRPSVAGLSFGGGLALEFARRHPTIPSSLVLASAYAGWAGSLPPEVVEQRLQQALRLADLPPAELVAAIIPTLFSASAPRDLVDEFATSLAEFHPAGLRSSARAFADADLRDYLHEIDIPTLLLYGADDVRAPADVAEHLHRMIRASKLVVMEGIGHMVNIEAAEPFDSEVRTFLRSLDA